MRTRQFRMTKEVPTPLVETHEYHCCMAGGERGRQVNPSTHLAQTLHIISSSTTHIAASLRPFTMKMTTSRLERPSVALPFRVEHHQTSSYTVVVSSQHSYGTQFAPLSHEMEDRRLIHSRTMLTSLEPPMVEPFLSAAASCFLVSNHFVNGQQATAA